MEWLATQLGARFTIHDTQILDDVTEGSAVYRFFETLFDCPNVANAKRIFELAAEKKIRLTPPPKPLFEEKMLLALLWNRNLQHFLAAGTGRRFSDAAEENRSLHLAHGSGAIATARSDPRTESHRLVPTQKAMSQKERDLILKVSGFSDQAWGARGVCLGSDLSSATWGAAVDAALAGFENSPSILQRFHKPALVDTAWFDFAKNELVPMKGRARLCPYYFVSGEGDNLRSALGGVLATVVPADKKIVHGMADAILMPCAV